MALKERISSPLEAGTSILDAHHLPPHLTPALEYTSRKLAKKSLHLTLVVVRRDYQLPSVVPPSPGSYTPATPNSPFSKFAFASSSISSLRQLVTRSSTSSLSSNKSTADSPQRSAINSPTYAPYPSPGLDSPRWRWPQSPSTPASPPPMTPSSSATDAMSSTVGGNAFVMKLVHASHLCPRAEKVLQTTLAKAEGKYNTGPNSLGPATSPVASGLSSQIYNSSVIQNEILFSSDGLTLLATDRLYSLKSALSSYTKSRSPLRLEDAVDELRRLVLARNGSPVPKSDLLRCYDWLSITHSAIGDLDRMYQRAYGGPGQDGGISGMFSFRDRMIQEPYIRHEDDNSDFEEDESDEDDIQRIDMAIHLMQPPPPKSVSPRPPLLKLQTTFDVKPAASRVHDDKSGEEEGEEEEEEEEEEEDGDRTAKPNDPSPVIKLHKWNPGSINQLLTADVLSPERTSIKFGPMTPQGYDDISPITRGEWGFMMLDNALSEKRAGLETC